MAASTSSPLIDDGDDQVNVRDRTADLARGGDGNDSVVADVGQLDILDGFEAVDRTPNATPPRREPHATGHHPGGKVKVKRGVASIKVTAPAGASGNSTGTLTVRTAKAVRLAGLKVTLQLGSARYNIAPGVSKTLKVKLAKAADGLPAATAASMPSPSPLPARTRQIAQSRGASRSRSARPRRRGGRHLLSPISMRAPADRAGARIARGAQIRRSPQPKEQA